MRYLITLLLCCSLRAADPWTKEQVYWELGYQAVLLVDWRQTSNIHKTWGDNPEIRTHNGGELIERNPLLGRRPKQSTINKVCISSAVGHLLISNYLHTKWRTRWQKVTFAIEAIVITDNYSECRATLRW